MAESLQTRCCISGGGPAGIMLGYMLARAGIDTIILEKWPDFFRDFRGDTIHPSTMEILRELGLLEEFLKLPHNETKELAVRVGGREVIAADFSHIKGSPFVGFIPQWDFLNFIAAEGRKYPGFRLMMETEVVDLLREGAEGGRMGIAKNESLGKNRTIGKIAGVRAKNKTGEFDIQAELVVGADGRHSTVREKAGLTIIDSGAPIDVLWFRISRKNDGKAQSLGSIDAGKMIVLIDRDDYWQCAYIIGKGDFEKIKARGLEAFRADITMLAPFIGDAACEVTSWDQVKLLSVAVDHLERWHMPGLVCIGDSAHAMSPVGGVGINLAIQDAVAAGNILVPAFRRGNRSGGVGSITSADLAAIQERREFPARVIQRLQIFIHTRIIAHILAGTSHIEKLPWQLVIFKNVPYLRRLPAWLIGTGVRPEKVTAFK